MPPPGTLKKRPIDEKELEETLQSQFKLPPLHTRAYLKMVEGHDVSAVEIAALLHIKEREAGVLLKEMGARGLIIKSPGEESRFAPLHPRMTLTNIFKTYEEEIVQALRDRRATVDRVVNLLTPLYEERRNEA